MIVLDVFRIWTFVAIRSYCNLAFRCAVCTIIWEVPLFGGVLLNGDLLLGRVPLPGNKEFSHYLLRLDWMKSDHASIASEQTAVTRLRYRWC